MTPSRQSGVIRNYYDSKGYGFIRKSDNSEEFFHCSECKDFEPEVGLKVQFNIGRDQRGRSKAIDITCEQSGRSK